MNLTLRPNLEILIISKIYRRNQRWSTNSERAVPAACAECHSIYADAQTTDSVLMTSQNANTFPLECVPNVARPIIVATKQNATRD